MWKTAVLLQSTMTVTVITEKVIEGSKGRNSMHKMMKRQLRLLLDRTAKLISINLLIWSIKLTKKLMTLEDSSRAQATLEEEVMQLNDAIKVEMSKLSDQRSSKRFLMWFVKEFAPSRLKIDAGYSPFQWDTVRQWGFGRCRYSGGAINPLIWVLTAFLKLKGTAPRIWKNGVSWEVNTVSPSKKSLLNSDRWKTLEIIGNLMRWEGLSRFLVAIRDMTEQRLLEKSLNEEKLHNQKNMDLIIKFLGLSPTRLASFFDSLDSRIDLLTSLIHCQRSTSWYLYRASYHQRQFKIVGLAVWFGKRKHSEQRKLSSQDGDNISKLIGEMSQLAQNTTKYLEIFIKKKISKRLNLYDIISQYCRNTKYS